MINDLNWWISLKNNVLHKNRAHENLLNLHFKSLLILKFNLKFVSKSMRGDNLVTREAKVNGIKFDLFVLIL